MSTDPTQKIPRPQLRGLLMSQTKIHLTVAIGLSALTYLVSYALYYSPRKRRYAEFYRNYDAEAEFHKMRNCGVFQSAEADTVDED